MSARLRALVALPALLMTVLTTLFGTGLATAPAADAATAKHHQHHQVSRVDRIIHGRNIALHQIGRPYRYGAAGPKSFDCSGLVYWSYRHAGFSVPRTSSAQAAHARHIPKNRLRTGDFMFFNDGGGVYHVCALPALAARARDHAALAQARPARPARRPVDQPVVRGHASDG